MAERFYCGEAPGNVTVREGAERWPLDPRVDLLKHSAGFGWGGADSNAGPAHQLALALLADALQNDARALRVHHNFNSRVVPLFPKRWTITRSRIVAYVEEIETEYNSIAAADMPRPDSFPPGATPSISL
jgi:hypothetical protein